MKNPHTFAPVTVRMRKMSNETIGDGLRVSITRNATKSAAEAISSPTVRPLPQPTSGACEIAYTSSDSVDVIVDAAEEHAGRCAAAADGAPDAERLVALCAFRERRRDDRQRRGRDDRGSDALRRARGDEHADRVGKSADERRGREDRNADHEQTAPTEQVGRPAPEQKKAAVGDRVRDQHPL